MNTTQESELVESASEAFRLSDPRQKRLYDRLLLLGRGPAAFYFDACRILAARPAFACASHLAAHAIREVEGAVSDVLKPLVGIEEQGDASSGKQDGHRRKIRAILKGLGFSEGDGLGKKWLALAGTDAEGRRLHGWAHRPSLEEPRPVENRFRQFFGDLEAVLDVVLARYESRYLRTHEELDRLLALARPTRADLKFLKKSIPNTLAARGYFFERLTSAEWIDGLQQNGFFDSPSPIERTERGFRFPFWPQSEYLMRMAPKTPDKVLEVLLRLPETDNERIHDDCAQAALGMPAAAAAKWIRKELPWLARTEHLYIGLEQRFGELVAHLAKGGEVDIAMDLASQLLDLRPDTRSEEDRAIHPSLDLPPEPRIRMDVWEYGDILEKHIPALLEAAPGRTFDLLCGLLERFCELGTRPGAKSLEMDTSFAWRPSIESSDQVSSRDGLRDLLVVAVRIAAEKLLRDRGEAVEPLVEGLERREWPIFRRMGIHVVRVFAERAPEVARKRLLNRASFEARALHHEWTLLLKERFGSLNVTDQETILTWIDEEWTVEKVRESLRKPGGEEPAQEQVERFAKIRKMQRLHPIRDALPPARRAEYDRWVQELGFEPEHPEFLVWHSGVTHVGSPISVEDLGKKDVPGLVTFLQDWQPPKGVFEPTREELGSALRVAVTADPGRYASEAVRFAGLNSAYIRGVLWGLREAIIKKPPASFPWDGVLRLCRWALEQPRNYPNIEANEDSDAGWVGVRNTMADLLGQGIRGEASSIGLEHREAVWTLLEALTHDPDPTPEYEAKYGGEPRDPIQTSINTVRGIAMHSAFKYGAWVRRHLDRERQGTGSVWRGFDDLPELRKVLEDHLDPQKDPALAIRAVYGQELRFLEWLDEQWLRANLGRIFPIAPESRRLHDAAWDAFLFGCWPSKWVFDQLAPSYQLAISRLTEPKSDKHLTGNPDHSLANHLILLVARGEVGLEHPLLIGFYEKAPDPARAEAINFIGRSLREHDWPSEALHRLKKLWERRLSMGLQASPEELEAFGSWFACGKFEHAWAIARLLDCLRQRPCTEPEHMVLEQLAKVAPSWPREAVECVRLLLDGTGDDRWKPSHWQDELKTILRIAIQGADAENREAALDLVNRLGAMGNFQFRDLLSPKRGGLSPQNGGASTG